jgi:predicted nucleotidyltransferase
MKLIEFNMEKISRLCKKYKVSKLFVLGSVLKDSFSNESDIDLVVDFDQVDLTEYADNYFDFKDKLELIFNRSVDLLEERQFEIRF